LKRPKIDEGQNKNMITAGLERRKRWEVYKIDR